jgi:acetate CoA/acetoacetate CoA-transferase alpha subunit
MAVKNVYGKLKSLEEAVAVIGDDCRLMYGGFGGVGTSPLLIDAIFNKGVRRLTLIGNDAGFPQVGVGRLVCNGQVSRMITTHIGSNPVAGKMMNEGTMEIEFSPQGTLAERIRAGGAGVGGILLDVGLETVVARGKPTVIFEDREWLIESPIRADVALVYAAKADPFGNLIYDKSARNFNPLVATAADITIVHAEEVVELGGLDPEEIVTPGVYVDMIVTGKGGEWTWAWE